MPVGALRLGRQSSGLDRPHMTTTADIYQSYVCRLERSVLLDQDARAGHSWPDWSRGGAMLSNDDAWGHYERLLRWRRRSPETIHLSNVVLHDLWADLERRGVKWGRLTPDDVEAWLGRRCHPGKRDAGLPLSRGTRATYGRKVATFYAAAAAHGWLEGGNPLADWRPPPRPARRPRALPVSAIGQLMVELAADRR